MEQNKPSISIMTLTDIDLIKNQLEIDFDNFWSYNILNSELKNPNSTYYKITINNEIIGFSGILTVLDEADITNIVIKKNYRNNGYSKLLLNHIIQECRSQDIKKINLEVSSTNTIAINLYKSFGFKQVGLRKNYYKTSDALLFTKKL